VAAACTTGEESELTETIGITPRPGPGRVVMRLSDGRRPSSFTRLPGLTPGDRLRVTAEVEVTTDCETANPACVGNPYTYAPIVTATLLLSGDRGATAPGNTALRLAERRVTCSHRRHHRVIVFTRTGLQIPEAGLPWSGPSFVNLVLDAHHPKARAGDRLLVGENEPDGSVGGDKGRINAIRLRPSGERPHGRTRTEKRLAREIPVDKEKRTVVYSRRLNQLRDDEELDVRAGLTVSAAHLSYPARISTRLILADDPGQDDDGGHAAEIAPFNGEISENNGFNCLRARACTSRKVGVLRCLESAGQPVYVNLVAVAGDPFREGRPGDKLRVLNQGFVEVRRYSSSREP
jgi:hypothetical protein